MSLNTLPPEILYKIVANVVVDYFDCAIASPPRPTWLRLDRGPLIIPLGSDQTEWSGITPQQFNRVLKTVLAHFGGDMSLADTPLLPLEATAFLDEDYEEPGEDETDEDDSDHEDSDNWGLEEDVIHVDGDGDMIYVIENGASQSRWAADEDDDSPLLTAEELSDGSDDEGEFTDDEDRNSEVDSEESYKRMLWEWNLNEKNQPLPNNQVTPLLAVNRYMRQTTFKVLSDTLNIKKSGNSSINFHKKMMGILRDVRRLYRLAHARPLRCGKLLAKYQGPGTPFIAAYVSLAQVAYSLCAVHRLLDPKDDADRVSDEALKFLKDTLRDIQCVHLTIPQAALRTRIAQRAHIFRVRYGIWSGLVTSHAAIVTARDEAVSVELSAAPSARQWLILKKLLNRSDASESWQRKRKSGRQRSFLTCFLGR
ncbi:unnamed protein product [Cyclocybe aegerita]|uniref:Uncharacterized protein n=1 Tax=Cyclocybe aegerita TaxID=1973307 RepID=A0A8S0VRZ2_CYCAE|nr:unnamed protein product [Cyclocybe aegerita]